MMYSTSKTIDNVIDAIADFIALYVRDAEIIRGQVNRVPSPKAKSFVVLTELLHSDLSTYADKYDSSSSKLILENAQKFSLQVDIYGDNSGDVCRALKTVFRGTYGNDILPDWLCMLYCDDGIQAPLITAEKQWGARWKLRVELQYSASVEVPQEYFGAAQINEIYRVTEGS